MYLYSMKYFWAILVFGITLADSFAESVNNDKQIFFISPVDGAVVDNPVELKFGAIGIKVVPAGVDEPMSGHHHLLINVDQLPKLDGPIPSDSNHIHYGKGQTEDKIVLPKGKHTLQLLLGNHIHVPHTEPLISEKIEITVK